MRPRGSKREENAGHVGTSNCGRRKHPNDVRTNCVAYSVLHNTSHICLMATFKNERALQMRHAALVTLRLLDSVERDLQAEMRRDNVRVACRNKRADRHGNLTALQGGNDQAQRLLQLAVEGRGHHTPFKI
ncbi:hypothetical protein KC352_g64 [Hortaea werneckii]|nr:hypothetical protein KC352_g64 [Hortaea werneckii]